MHWSSAGWLQYCVGGPDWADALTAQTSIMAINTIFNTENTLDFILCLSFFSLSFDCLQLRKAGTHLRLAGPLQEA